MTSPFSTAHIDYLQRVTKDLAPAPRRPAADEPQVLGRLWHVRGIGQVDKEPERKRDPRSRLPTEELTTALYGPKIRLAFMIRSTQPGVAIYLGTWIRSDGEREKKGALQARHHVVKAALDALYPRVDAVESSQQVSLPAIAGLALGIPSARLGDAKDESAPLDRLIRALPGANWTTLILAEPLEEETTGDLRDTIINEMRAAQGAAQSGQVPSPLAEHYVALLKTALTSFSSGLTIGMWRTAVYLLGDADTYPRLASLWRGVFSGDDSLPEPVHVWQRDEAAELAAKWSMPNTAGAPGPGFYRHPLQCQTLLTSAQLAAYVHFPTMETNGFAISMVPAFDAEPPRLDTDKTISLGTIIVRSQPSATEYAVDPKRLTKHAFVAGTTGSGKTNTVFHLLTPAAVAGIPFPGFGPAKAEYRALPDDPNLGDKLQIFTLGNDLVSPFRINPFEVVSWPSIPVGLHLDLLRSVFTASFGMWTPLPQILEQCLQRVYIDRGWDITANHNTRLDEGSLHSRAFPTLSDLAEKAEEIIKELGYEEKISDDMRAALLTRINGLRVGGKGTMLDVEQSIPMDRLLARPTILELQGVGDDDDKAFLIGLLIVRLYELRRASGEAGDLQHLLVVEEAHRLLTNVGSRKSEEESDPRGKAVETFVNVLSEIRAYGQGVIVADQVPVKLEPEVIKNTNLKIAHRVVAADDRAELAGAMLMDERQARAIGALDPGDAAVFNEGADAPLLVRVPKVKDLPGKAPPNDDQVRARMVKTIGPVDPPYAGELAEIDWSEPSAQAGRDLARHVTEDPYFRRDFVRLVISITEDDDALERLLPALFDRANAARRPNVDEKVLQRCLLTYATAWFAARRGRQAGRSYSETAELESALRQVLFAKLAGNNPKRSLSSFRDVTQRFHRRAFPPFAGCGEICRQDPPVCLYRHAVADFVSQSGEGSYGTWRSAYVADLAGGQGETKGMQACWTTVSEELVRGTMPRAEHEGTFSRIELCYAQHMLAREPRDLHDTILERLLRDRGDALSPTRRRS